MESYHVLVAGKLSLNECIHFVQKTCSYKQTFQAISSMISSNKFAHIIQNKMKKLEIKKLSI